MDGQYDDGYDESDDIDEIERASLTPEQLFDMIHPRDENGRFITREYDVSDDAIDLFNSLGEVE